MRTVPRIKWGRVVMIVVGSTLLAIGMMYAFILGVVDYSLKQYPPTNAELHEDSSLVRYIDPDDQILETYRK